MPLPTSPISINEEWISHLEQLQCNIVKHHGRTHAWHVFFEIQDGKAPQAQKWLTKLKPQLKTALEQIQDGIKYRKSLTEGCRFDGGVVETVSFTYAGIQRLEICNEVKFETEFCEGMVARKDELFDDVSKFDEGFKRPLHGLLMIADNSKGRGRKRLRQRLLELSAFATVHMLQKGKQERRGKIAVEHFGYADGISQPLFLESEIEAQHNKIPWDDKAEANTLLVMTADKQHVGGSYLVFRKLEQNVQAFNRAEHNFAPGNGKHLCHVANAAGYNNSELPSAMAVGRFKDGTPVTQHSEAIGRQSNKEMDNAFNYAGDSTGLRCPRFSHIRLTNPRREEDKEHRITRRGIPYNDTGLKRRFDSKNENLTLYTHNLGLLFMCYQSNIKNQFEFIQRQWANLGSVANLPQVGKDPIVGQEKPSHVLADGNTEKKFLPQQWGNITLHHSPINFDGFVTTKGGEYFFTPTFQFL